MQVAKCAAPDELLSAIELPQPLQQSELQEQQVQVQGAPHQQAEASPATSSEVLVVATGVVEPQQELEKHQAEQGGLRTAAGKPIAASAVSQQRAQELLAGCDTDDPPPSTAFVDSMQGPQQPEEGPRQQVGFQTAGGRTITADPKRQQRAQALLASCNADVALLSTASADSMQGQKQPEECPREQVGFQTAGGRTITADPKRQQRAQALLASCNTDVALLSTAAADSMQGKKQPEECPREQVGFQTAGGRTITADPKRQQRAQALLASCNADVPVLSTAFADSMQAQQQPEEGPRQQVGFQTAGGSTITADPKRQQRAQALLASCNADVPVLSTAFADSMQAQQQPEEGPRQQVGFQTAGGRTITADPKRQQRAQALLASCNADVPLLSTASADSMQEQKQPEECPSEQVGFQTAGGRTITADPKRQQRAQALLASCNADVALLSTASADAMQRQQQPEERQSEQAVVHFPRMPNDAEPSILSLHLCSRPGESLAFIPTPQRPASRAKRRATDVPGASWANTMLPDWTLGLLGIYLVVLCV